VSVVIKFLSISLNSFQNYIFSVCGKISLLLASSALRNFRRIAMNGVTPAPPAMNTPSLYSIAPQTSE
jgi:hypothetical protein